MLMTWSQCDSSNTIEHSVVVREGVGNLRERQRETERQTERERERKREREVCYIPIVDYSTLHHHFVR